MHGYEYVLCQVSHAIPREAIEPSFPPFATVASGINVFHGSVVLLCKVNLKRQQKLTFYKKEKGC